MLTGKMMLKTADLKLNLHSITEAFGSNPYYITNGDPAYDYDSFSLSFAGNFSTGGCLSFYGRAESGYSLWVVEFWDNVVKVWVYGTDPTYYLRQEFNYTSYSNNSIAQILISGSTITVYVDGVQLSVTNDYSVGNPSIQFSYNEGNVSLDATSASCYQAAFWRNRILSADDILLLSTSPYFPYSMW